MEDRKTGTPSIAELMSKQYQDILDTVIENGRLEYYTEDEFREEIEFEARERNLNDEQTREAVEYAFEHFDLYEARAEIIRDALEWAIIAAQDIGGPHPDPSALLRDLEVQDIESGLIGTAGDAWDFYDEETCRRAFLACEREFLARLPWVSGKKISQIQEETRSSPNGLIGQYKPGVSFSAA